MVHSSLIMEHNNIFEIWQEFKTFFATQQQIVINPT